eukprot:Phypoly_transcript_11031.p1 GENE.Phypoly_transcript_11031~~Phypoly_transcript_11031.p1  ORF type:complete len:404 (+),score=87.42 Phypoly_transcript_11031:68-1213(+)
MADKQDILESFKAVTGASNEEAQFFLEANAWNLDVATSAFLDSEDMSVHQPPPNRGPAQPPQTTTHHAPQPQPTSAPKKTSSGPARGGVATLRDFGNKDDSDSEEDDDKVQKYYAGGEKSGQMIHYPKDKGGKKDVVADVFNSAKRQGATEVEENKPAAPSYFSGTGFKLGDNVTQSTAVKPAAAAKPAAGARQEVHRTVTFWRNGFTVDNGPFRTMDDPANEQFLEDISRGVVPTELEQGAPPGTNYSVNLVDKRQEEYKEPPKPKVQAFSGSGQTLGSTASAPPPAATQPAAKPPGSFQVDESQPTTSIQLRLGDGTRLVAKFNHTHTVGDIRRFVDAARRGTQAYNLMTTFPQKVLTDNTQTIAAAGLQNAVIVQQML